MSEILRPNAADRVLVMAPHPDDEAIACGSLLLAAQAAGAARRVVVVTDGDNNPWPQRWIERRWRIDAAARARWGARRRAEAQAALDVLGVDVSERQFLGLADTGLTDLLMRDPQALPGLLAEQLEKFRPTLIALPALEDRHPDHSAVHIALRLALLRADVTPQCLIYSVHAAAIPAQANGLEIATTWREQKRQAIARHVTQMRLSGKRFLACADTPERYYPMATPPRLRVGHPLRAYFRSPGELQLRIHPKHLHGARNLQLQLLLEGENQHLRWCLPLAAAGASVAATDESGQHLQDVQWRHEGGDLLACVAVARSHGPRLGYAKLARKQLGLLIFDRYGWQVIENQPVQLGQN